MESLAARYTMTFLGLHTFDHWGQSCTTGIFEKDGREFVFVPGDTVTLGWEQFAEGLNQESREELDYLFQEWEMEPQNPEEMIRESMAPVRQVAIGPMLVGRELEEINWEPVKLEDPRLRSEWLEDFRQFALTDRDSLTLAGRARFERMVTAGRSASITRWTIWTFKTGCKTGLLPAHGGRVGLPVRRRVSDPVPMGRWVRLLHASALV